MTKPRIGVIGLAGQSAFLRTPHLPAPGESVICDALFFELGGKGYNQAVAAARMGVDTVFIGAVGDDEYGSACERELEQEGVTPCLIRKKAPTAFATITTAADGENTVAVCPGAAKELTGEDLLVPEVEKVLKSCTMLLLQNELRADCLREAIAFANRNGIPVILNPAPAPGLPLDLLPGCDLITPNYGEALCLTGLQPEATPAQLASALKTLGPNRSVVTMGGRGALIVSGDNPEHIPAVSFGPTVDTTGAGDTFNGVLAGAMASGYSLREAVKLAVRAAGISVTRKGAVACIPRREAYLF